MVYYYHALGCLYQQYSCVFTIDTQTALPSFLHACSFEMQSNLQIQIPKLESVAPSNAQLVEPVGHQ